MLNTVRLQQFKLLKGYKSNYGLFDVSTNKMYKISKSVYDILFYLKLGHNIQEISSMCFYSKESIESTINSLEKLFMVDNEPKQDAPIAKNYLGKLMLVTTTNCNFNCKYCYADGGTYHQTICNMNEETVQRVLDEVYACYEYIKVIQIFGGEPLLNFKVLEFICTYLEQKVGKNNIPLIGINTNLSIIPAGFIELVQEYNIHVCASIDGPEDIHNKLRIGKNGEETYALVSNNIKFLQKATGQPKQLEVTYTKEHINAGYKRDDINTFLSSEFGVSSILLANAGNMSTSKNSKQNEGLFFDNNDIINQSFKFKDSLKNALRLLEKGILDYDPLKSLVFIAMNAKSNYYCTTGLSIITVLPNGDMYPCQLFIDKEEWYMGNCLTDGIKDNKKFYNIQESLKASTKDNNLECKNCFAKGLCHACIASIYDKYDKVNPIDKEYCNATRDAFNLAIISLFELKSDELKWEVFINNFKNIRNWVYEYYA